jgi:hypothetical protein
MTVSSDISQVGSWNLYLVLLYAVSCTCSLCEKKSGRNLGMSSNLEY